MALNNVSLLLLLIPFTVAGQVDTAGVNKKQLRTVVIASSVAYGITLVGLNQLWYKDSNKQSFRFFNDNAEWKQVDKLGHLFSAFYFSYGASRGLQACRVAPAKADFIGAITGFAVLVPIEIFDGFSDAYGASAGDLIADAGGAALYLGQQRLWHEVRIYPKFSFTPTSFAAQRPNVLGDNAAAEILKDYNGQTYWLSVDMDKFIRFPRWLNLAAGYGAEGMIYARDYQNLQAGFPLPYRQYYLGLDIDLTSIKTKSKAVRTLLFLANMIRLPAPAVEFSPKGVTFHALKF